MTQIDLQLPSNGTVVDATLHANNYAEIQAVINGNLDSDNISASADINDSQLASANNSVYRTVLRVEGALVGGLSANDYQLTADGAAVSNSNETAGYMPAGIMYIDPAAFLVSGLSTKYRVLVQLLVNNISQAGRTYKAGLYPISSIAGGNNSLDLTMGTVTTGSEATVAAPAVNSLNQASSSDFTAPAAGHFILGVNVSGGAVPANSRLAFAITLQFHNV